MTTPLSQEQLNDYIFELRQMCMLEKELSRIRQTMVSITKQPRSTAQQRNVVHINQIFRALLAEKTRQEIVDNMRYNNGSSSQNSSTGPADDAPRSIRIRYILQ